MPDRKIVTFTLPKVVNGRTRTAQEATAEAKTRTEHDGFKRVVLTNTLPAEYEFTMYR